MQRYFQSIKTWNETGLGKMLSMKMPWEKKYASYVADGVGNVECVNIR